MRVLVIGGTRFIGPHVVRMLVAAGHAVTLLHRGKSAVESPSGVVGWIAGDRDDLAPLADAIRHAAPDVVIDMIALNERQAVEAVRTFRGIARRAVVISSMDVYRAYGVLIGIENDVIEPVPFDEDAPLRSMLYPYRKSAKSEQDFAWSYDKIPVERAYLGEPDLPGTVLRLPMVYGPGDYQHRLYQYLKRMDDGRPAIPVGRRQASWRTARGFVENVAAAIALAATDDRAANRVYNVADAEPHPEAEWVHLIARETGWTGEVVVAPDELMSEGEGANWAQDLVADTTRIRRELGYIEHVKLGDALRRTVEWERANPPRQVNPAQFDYAADDEIIAKVRAKGGRS